MKKLLGLFLALILAQVICGQRMPLTFQIAQEEAILPAEPRVAYTMYLVLSDTIDYKGRRIAKETIMSTEKNFDTLGRLVMQTDRWGDTTNVHVQTWNYQPSGTIYTMTHISPNFQPPGALKVVLLNNAEVPPKNNDEKSHDLSISYQVDGQFELYYAAQYDSSQRLISQYENTGIMPNHYYITGILQTNYTYDAAGRCVSAVTRNDSGFTISRFRCAYNSMGQITVWDARELLFGYRNYDSLVYDDLGNLIYAIHLAQYEQSKEYFMEYDSHGKITHCIEKVAGEITQEQVCHRENGLLLSMITTQYQFGTTTTSTYVRHYEFYN